MPEHKILIDTGDRANRQDVELFLSKVVDFKEIDIVLFTHLHYDHIGNFDFFPNAKFYASKVEIDDFKKDKYATILKQDIADMFTVQLSPLPSLDCFEYIFTPGHTNGSVCIWFEKEKVLFTGDTVFGTKTGRTDLPTSVPEKMQESLSKLSELTYEHFCPGHDYE